MNSRREIDGIKDRLEVVEKEMGVAGRLIHFLLGFHLTLGELDILAKDLGVCICCSCIKLVEGQSYEDAIEKKVREAI